MEKKNKILFIIFIVIFIFLFISVKTGLIQSIDNRLYEGIKSWKNETGMVIFKMITDLGGIVSLFCITLVTVLILFLGKKRKAGVAVTVNLIISTISYIGFKNIIQRPRPPVQERLIEETGYSFPSGHSTNNMAFYVLAIVLLYPKIKNKKLRNSLCVILASIPLLIGFSRVYLGVHYISDILAGFSLGIICVILFMSFGYPKIK
ncbi:MAG: phosphatase PAP2 family protein [Clostridia bacterium]|nr:phosphatase PAP2 family protein [Clostridia bacterium]